MKTSSSDLQVELAVTSERGMLKRLDDGHIRVLQVGVLADKRDCHLIEQAFLPKRELSERTTNQVIVLTGSSIPSSGSPNLDPYR